VPDLSPAVIQAAANALHAKCETHWASLPDDIARGTTMHWADAHYDAATAALAAAAPLIRAEALEEAAEAIEAVHLISGNKPIGPSMYAAAVRGLVEDPTLDAVAGSYGHSYPWPVEENTSL
jgi:hypothetical protein